MITCQLVTCIKVQNNSPKNQSATYDYFFWFFVCLFEVVENDDIYPNLSLELSFFFFFLLFFNK